MSRTPTIVTLITVMIALLSYGDIEASTDSSDHEIAAATRETIAQHEHEFNDAILDRDEAALNRLLADDYTSGGNWTRTKTEHIDQIVTTIPPKTQTIDSMSMRLYGDTAIVTGLVTADLLSPEGAETKTFRRVNVWVRGANGWQIVYQSTVVVFDSSMSDC